MSGDIIARAKTHKDRVRCSREYVRRGLVTQYCPHCDYPVSLEIDAEGIINCDSCNQPYKILDMMEHIL